MPLIELDEDTAKYVWFASHLCRVSPSNVVREAVRRLAEETPLPSRFEPVRIYGVYANKRVEAEYLPESKRVLITGEPLDGERFSSPSGAARAVVAALNPDREATQTNGWRFWRLVDTDARLEVLK